MLDATDEKINVEQCVTGGTLTDLITSGYDDNASVMDRLPEGQQTEGVKKLLSQKWDIVIVTEDIVSVLTPAIREISTWPAIAWVDSIVKSNGGRTILFQCYPYVMRSNGPNLTQFWKNYTDLKFFNRNQQAAFDSANEISRKGKAGMQIIQEPIFRSDSVVMSIPISGYAAQVLEAKFYLDQIAKKINARVLPVGYLMELCRIKHPEISLYQGIAPSKAGCYLIACATYKFLTGKSLRNNSYDPGLLGRDAQIIKELIDSVYF